MAHIWLPFCLRLGSNGRRLLPTVIGTMLCALTGPGLAAPSTYPRSCTHLGISGDTLHADCRRDDGSLNHTSITLPGIENVGGVLRFVGLGHQSTFQDSCAHISLAGTILAAECRSVDGRFKRSSISIPDIAAVDGVLTIVSSGSAQHSTSPQASPTTAATAGGSADDGGYDYDGQAYEWYDDGWRGPGFYITGFAFRRGLGYGGGEGWRGWHHGGFHQAHGGWRRPVGPGAVGLRRARIVHVAREGHRGHGGRPVLAHRAGIFHARFVGRDRGGFRQHAIAHRGGGARPRFAFRHGGGFRPHPVRRVGGFHRGGFRPVIHRIFVRPRRHR